MKKEHDLKIPERLKIGSTQLPMHFKTACLKIREYFILQET
jgi:hypothetical protein